MEISRSLPIYRCETSNQNTLESFDQDQQWTFIITKLMEYRVAKAITSSSEQHLRVNLLADSLLENGRDKFALAISGDDYRTLHCKILDRSNDRFGNFAFLKLTSCSQL